MVEQTSLTRIFSSPIRFFRGRVPMPPSWPVALAPVVADTLIAAAGGAVAAHTGQMAIASALVAIDRGGGAAPYDAETLLLGGLVIGVAATIAVSVGYFVVISMAAVGVDLLFAQSGRARRLVEFTGYAYLVRLPWALSSVAILVWWWGSRAVVAAAIGDAG